MRILTLLGIALSFGSSSMALADTDFTNYLRSELRRTNAALNAPGPVTPVADDAWDFTNFYLRLQATVGFSVPHVINVNIVPNVELVWHKIPHT